MRRADIGMQRTCQDRQGILSDVQQNSYTPHSILCSNISCSANIDPLSLTQVGSFNKKDLDVGTGLVGAPACGDVMKLQIKVDDNGVIQQAVFKTFGCGK